MVSSMRRDLDAVAAEHGEVVLDVLRRSSGPTGLPAAASAAPAPRERDLSAMRRRRRSRSSLAPRDGRAGCSRPRPARRPARRRTSSACIGIEARRLGVEGDDAGSRAWAIQASRRSSVRDGLVFRAVEWCLRAPRSASAAAARRRDSAAPARRPAPLGRRRPSHRRVRRLRSRRREPRPAPAASAPRPSAMRRVSVRNSIRAGSRAALGGPARARQLVERHGSGTSRRAAPARARGGSGRRSRSGSGGACAA